MLVISLNITSELTQIWAIAKCKQQERDRRHRNRYKDDCSMALQKWRDGESVKSRRHTREPGYFETVWTRWGRGK